MSGRARPRPRHRSVLRTSQPSRSEQQSVIRAYELALPILGQPTVEKPTSKSSAAAKSRRRRSPILLGA